MAVGVGQTVKKLALSRSLTSQSLVIAALTAVAQAINALVFVVAARSTTPASFGAIVVLVSTGIVASGIFDFGSNTYCVREGAALRLSVNEWSSRLTGKLAAMGAILMVGSATLMISDHVQWIPVLLVATGQVATQVSQVPMRADAKGHWIAVIQLLERVVTLVVVAIMISLSRVGSALWIGVCLGSVASLAGSALMARKRTRLGLRLSSQPRNPWEGTTSLGISGSVSTAQAFDLNLVSAIAGSPAAGVYGAVNKWTNPMGLMASAYSQAALPFMARGDFSGKERRHAWRSMWVLVAAAFGCLVLALFSHTIVRVALGTEYGSSGEILAILALGTIPAIFNQPLAVFLQARGRARAVSWSLVLGVASQMVLVVTLAGRFGATGAAIAFGASQVIIGASLMVCLRKEVAA